MIEVRFRRNIIIYFALILSSLTVNYYYRSYMASMTFYILISAMLFSILYTLLIFKNVNVEYRLDKSIVTKEDATTLKCTFYLKRSYEWLSMLNFYLPIKATFANNEKLFEGQFQNTDFLIENINYQLSFDVLFKYKGVYKMGVEEIETTDILKLFKFKKTFEQINEMVVYPKIINLNEYNQDIRNTRESARNTVFKSSDLSSIREYEPGDAQNKIHWKVSAKHTKLFTKQYASLTQDETLFILDTMNPGIYGEERIILEDKIIESTLAVLNHYAKESIPTEVLVPTNSASSSIKIIGFEEFNHVFKKISFVPFNTDYSIKNVVAEYFVNKGQMINQSNTITIFTCNIYKEFYSELTYLKSKNINIRVIYISMSELYHDIVEMEDEYLLFLDENNIDYIRINISDDIVDKLGVS